MEATLYFVSVFKHGAPQCIVAGPFSDSYEAVAEAKDREERSRLNSFCVVTATLPVELWEFDSHAE